MSCTHGAGGVVSLVLVVLEGFCVWYSCCWRGSVSCIHGAGGVLCLALMVMEGFCVSRFGQLSDVSFPRTTGGVSCVVRSS